MNSVLKIRGLILLAVAGAATVEAVVLTLTRHNYDWRAYFVAFGVALGRRVMHALPISASAALIAVAAQHPLGHVRVDGVGSWLLLFLGVELCYYWLHRASHRIRWFWASHAVHHAPRDLNLSVGFQLAWTDQISGTSLFFVPLVWLGFNASAVFSLLGVSLLYQFWLHSSWIPRLGPLEWILNTPSHHRVHHACNVEYLGRSGLGANYGGTLIVFDRLFGTYVPERDDLPCRYGLRRPLDSRNPVFIAFHEWIALVRDVWHAQSWRIRMLHVFGRPA